jgi:hypothetical protein
VTAEESEWVNTTLVARNWRVDGLRQGRWTMQVSTEEGETSFEYLFGLPGRFP